MALSASQYHFQTSYSRFDMKGHGLDWSNQPLVFKTYRDLPTVALPDVSPLSRPFLSDLIKQKSSEECPRAMDLESLAGILKSTHAVTAKARHGGGDFYYRNVASAGALYPFEIYVGTTGVRGLDDGLYHHSLAHSLVWGALTQLRSGDITPWLTEGLHSGAGFSPAVTFFFTSIFFRSAWKYRDRAYRYHLLDTGHLIENGMLASLAQGVPLELMYDFDDDKINALLGVDPKREVCLAVGRIGERNHGPARGQVGPLGPLFPGCAEASRVSSYEEDMTLIRSIHAVSSSVTHPMQEGPCRLLPDPGSGETRTSVSLKEVIWPEQMDFADAVYHRRSKRNFIRRDLTSSAFYGLLELLCFKDSPPQAAGNAIAYAVPSASGVTDTYWAARDVVSIGLLCSHVEKQAAGFYVLDRNKKTISLALEGLMAESMAHICLGQAWLGNCALHVLFMSHLDAVERYWGPRGYRYAMLNAGRLGQRLYLGATAMGLGCCGIGAFYDEEVCTLLGTSAMKLLYLVAVGPVKGLG